MITLVVKQVNMVSMYNTYVHFASTKKITVFLLLSTYDSFSRFRYCVTFTTIFHAFRLLLVNLAVFYRCEFSLTSMSKKKSDQIFIILAILRRSVKGAVRPNGPSLRLGA